MGKTNWLIWLVLIFGCLLAVFGYAGYKRYKYNQVVKEYTEKPSKLNFITGFLNEQEKDGSGIYKLCKEVSSVPFTGILEYSFSEVSEEKGFCVVEIRSRNNGKAETKKWKIAVKDYNNSLCVASITELK